jgi:hypothetical protein
MTDYGLAELMRIAAWLRYLEHWAGVPPCVRPEYVEAAWLGGRLDERPGMCYDGATRTATSEAHR